MPRYIDPDTGAVLEYIPPPTPAKGQASAGKSLGDYFNNTPGTTLKLQPKIGYSLQQLIEAAYSYVCIDGHTYNRVEFKFNNCYFVVARLKEER